MTTIKRFVYGLPIMKGYRAMRTGSLARQYREHPDGFYFAGSSTFFSPRWENSERAAIKSALAQSAVFIDVGANQGYYSCLAATMGLQVVAIEPEEGNLRFLYSNIMRNRFEVEVFPLALDASPGIKNVYGDGDTASLVEGWHGAEGGFSQLMPTNTMDNLFASRWPSESIFVKIDVEGFETNVIQGARTLLAAPNRPNWLIESFIINRDKTRSFNTKFRELFNIMFAHGYVCYKVDTQDRVSPDQIEEWCKDPTSAETGLSNFLFLNEVNA